MVEDGSVQFAEPLAHTSMASHSVHYTTGQLVVAGTLDRLEAYSRFQRGILRNVSSALPFERL
jgi:hypothetical protein